MMQDTVVIPEQPKLEEIEEAPPKSDLTLDLEDRKVQRSEKMKN